MAQGYPFVKVTDDADKNRVLKEFEALCKPLQDWLLKNYDMMAMAIVECGYAQVVSDYLGVPLDFDD